MDRQNTLSTLPVEVLLDNVLVFLSPRDLLTLGATSRYFHNLCNDDILWRRKLLEDFNYPLAANARTSGYKFLYQGMKRPKVYVWGQVDNGRLGLDAVALNRSANRSFSGVPYPVELKSLSSKGVRIVQLAAGGWSFHALDSAGTVWVWGQLNGEGFAFNSDAFSDPARRAVVPHKLELPARMRSISCGRSHSLALDSRSQVWVFKSWGRPFRIVSPLLATGVVQVESGWDFSAALTESGDVFVWWPGYGDMRRLSEENDARMAEQRPLIRGNDTQNTVIKCEHWQMHSNPLGLPALPNLPDLFGDDVGRPAGYSDTVKIVQIAGGRDFLVALTNRNHVLKIELSGGGDDEGFETLRTAFRRGQRWEYLPLFSEGARVAQLDAFTPGKVDAQVPADMRITHISANFGAFVAYTTGSSSIVLMGSQDTRADTAPKILPSIQNRSIISVVLGDYHFAALTSNGELLTWGSFSAGALGLGDPQEIEPGQPGGYRNADERDRSIRARRTPPDVREPAKVRFDHQEKRPRNKFCYAVAAAGWHVGALVIDLDEDEETEATKVHEPGEHSDHDDDAGPSMPGSFDREPPFVHDHLSYATPDHFSTAPGIGLPHDPNHLLAQGFHGIRIGYAARGAFRGRGMGGPPHSQED